MTPECVALKPLKYADASPCNGDNFILRTVYNTLATKIALSVTCRQQAGRHLGLVQSPKLSNRLNRSSLGINFVMSHLTRVTNVQIHSISNQQVITVQVSTTNLQSFSIRRPNVSTVSASTLFCCNTSLRSSKHSTMYSEPPLSGAGHLSAMHRAISASSLICNTDDNFSHSSLE